MFKAPPGKGRLIRIDVISDDAFPQEDFPSVKAAIAAAEARNQSRRPSDDFFQVFDDEGHPHLVK